MALQADDSRRPILSPQRQVTSARVKTIALTRVKGSRRGRQPWDPEARQMSACSDDTVTERSMKKLEYLAAVDEDLLRRI